MGENGDDAKYLPGDDPNPNIRAPFFSTNPPQHEERGMRVKTITKSNRFLSQSLSTREQLLYTYMIQFVT